MAKRLVFTYGPADVQALIEKDMINRGFELMVVRKNPARPGYFSASVISEIEVEEEFGVNDEKALAYEARERVGGG